MKVASAKGVGKIFGSGAAAREALSGVDLDVAPGDVLLLIGPSGSGKTTLLSILGCILRPTSGSVHICGQNTESLDRRQLAALRLQHIGFVFQDFNLLPTLSAVENAELPLQLRNMTARKARSAALELLDGFGLSREAHARPSDLSGGQKQRVAVARAVIGSPELVLADEPTAALDWQSGRGVLELLSGLARSRNCGVVIVSHDVRARQFVDREVRLEDGRLAKLDTAIDAQSNG